MKKKTSAATPVWFSEALTHLHASDPVLSRVIAQVGPCLLPRRTRRYAMLVGSIISQQISTKAADAILRRLRGAVAPNELRPELVAALSEETLQAAGLSAQKRRYLRDLTEKVLTGQVRPHRLHHLSDEEVIAELTSVKGIGVWTAQMFLIFALNRPNVFPYDDLGIRNAIRNLYGLKTTPDKKQAHQIFARWAPYATVATWYCWRSLEFPKATWSQPEQAVSMI